MVQANRKQHSLYEEAEAGLSSLVQQIIVVFTGFIVMLLLTGGKPSAVVMSLSFCSGIIFVAWSEQKRFTKLQNRNNASLNNPQVFSSEIRELLSTGNDYQKTYINANLRGVNLDGANLNHANLKRADLTGASLRQADLRGANLTEVQAIGADFSGALLTGACLEAWNIDHTTNLEQVDCEYVFLLEEPNLSGSRERLPRDPNRIFESNDFEKLFKIVDNTVQVLVRNGISREAFSEAFQSLIKKNPEIRPDSIEAIQRTGKDILLTIRVSESSDTVRITQEFLEFYEMRLRQLSTESKQRQPFTDSLEEIALALLALAHSQVMTTLSHSGSITINLGRDNHSESEGVPTSTETFD